MAALRGRGPWWLLSRFTLPCANPKPLHTLALAASDQSLDAIPEFQQARAFVAQDRLAAAVEPLQRTAAFLQYAPPLVQVAADVRLARLHRGLYALARLSPFNSN